MNNLSDGLEHLLVPDDAVVEAAVTRGLVVLDTNVLLEGYRYQPQTRDELFEVLERLGDRLWIPHQVAAEFLANRLTVMAGLDTTYHEVIEAVRAHRAATAEALGEKIRHLANRVAMDSETRDQLLDNLTAGLTAVEGTIEQLRVGHGGGMDAASNDPVLRRLTKILDGKVGPAPDPADLPALREEAQRRIDTGIPPGFRDRDKADPCGDHIIWAQSLQEAKRRRLPLLFVTRDDRKGDWFLTIKGRTMCALPDLHAEARRVAGVPLVLAQPQTLLVYATRYLNTPISDATLLQAANNDAPPPHTVREVLVSRAVLADMINLTNNERQQLATRLAALAERRTTALQHTTGPVPALFADTGDDTQTEFDEAAAALRRTERILQLLRRATCGETTVHPLIRWHGYPTQTQMEDLAERAEHSRGAPPDPPDTALDPHRQRPPTAHLQTRATDGVDTRNTM